MHYILQRATLKLLRIHLFELEAASIFALLKHVLYLVAVLKIKVPDPLKTSLDQPPIRF